MNTSIQYKLAEELSIKKIENEIFILNRETSSIHTFNEVGACIWKSLEKQKAINDIADVLTLKFDISISAAKKDINEFMEILKTNNLINFS